MKNWPNLVSSEFFEKVWELYDVNETARGPFCNSVEAKMRALFKYNFLKSSDVYSGAGTVGDDEFFALQKLAKEASSFGGPIIEIGTLFGYSTQALCFGKHAETKLITVDSFCWNPIGLSSIRHEEFTRKNLRYFTETQNVQVVRSTASDFYKTYSGECPSLIFIDADHSYDAVHTDISFALDKDAKIICGDDISWPGVRKAVYELLGEDISIVGKMWLHRKIFTP